MLNECGPSPQESNGQVMSSKAGPEELVFLTINVNSWLPFRDRWAEEGEPEELRSATVLFLQEHQLTTAEACSDAEEWSERRGWNAVFRRAAILPSGRSSGGSPFY